MKSKDGSVEFTDVMVRMPSVQLANEDIEKAYYTLPKTDLYVYTQHLRKKLVRSLLSERTSDWDRGDEVGIDEEGDWYYRFHGGGDNSRMKMWENGSYVQATDADKEVMGALSLITTQLYSNNI